jgi:hypothetical protein
MRRDRWPNRGFFVVAAEQYFAQLRAAQVEMDRLHLRLLSDGWRYDEAAQCYSKGEDRIYNG